MSPSLAGRPVPRARGAVLAALAAAALALPATATAAPAAGRPHHPPHGTEHVRPLPLGERGLAETRTTRALQPGVTLTRIVRGHPDPDHVWTVEVSIPGGSTSPDPDAPPTALKDEGSAREAAAALRALGFDARVEEVVT